MAGCRRSRRSWQGQTALEPGRARALPRQRRAASVASWKRRLLRVSRKSRQLADVAQVVLDDHGRAEVRGDLLHPLDRGARLRAVVIESRHAVRLVVLVEVRGVAAQQEILSRRDAHEEARVPGRVAGCADHPHRAVAPNVLVERQGLDLAGIRAHPVLEARLVRALHRRDCRDAVPVALADEKRRIRERRELAGMVAVEVADADVFHLLRLHLHLGEALDDADLRCVRVRARRETGVPDHVLVAVLDQVAAERESQREVRLVRERVAEALGDVGGLRGRAAFDAGQRDFGCRLRQRGQREQRAGDRRPDSGLHRLTPPCNGPMIAASRFVLSLSPPYIILISRQGALSTRENTVLHKTLGRILGCALLSYGSTALAFTLIELQLPSNTITDSFTLQAQVQPIAGTIRAQIFGLRRPGSSKKVTQVGGMMLAANDHSGSASDVNTLAAAANDPSGAGGGSGGGNAQSLWISSTNDSLENTFSRTAFYGATQNVLVGYDVTRSDKYVLGISGGYEASNFATQFNSGNEKTRGYNFNPYFAWLLSNAWSVDVIGGYGRFNTDQSRT